MKRVIAGGMCMAAAVVLNAGVAAQAGQPPAQPPAQSPAPQEMKAAAEQVTIVGCVQKEADYRRAKDAGKGGIAGTGVGADNEFVLINAATSAPAGAPPAPVGTSGTTGTDAFELTGTNETQAEPFIGKRVEIVGTLKAAETGPAGPTGGATAGAPPAGVDVASADLKLREVEVISVRETSGTCAPVR